MKQIKMIGNRAIKWIEIVSLLIVATMALARYFILDMNNMDIMHMIGVSAAVLVLALAVLVIRYGHYVIHMRFRVNKSAFNIEACS